jgi:hypothetical protein
MTQLDHLVLFGNYLSGSIPNGIGALTRLTTLWLLYNDLTGTIPAGVGDLTVLTQLLLQENRMSGTIPPLPASLTSCQLAQEDSNWIWYTARKTEQNCFTDISNAGICTLSRNCP